MLANLTIRDPNHFDSYGIWATFNYFKSIERRMRSVKRRDAHSKWLGRGKIKKDIRDPNTCVSPTRYRTGPRAYSDVWFSPKGWIEIDCPSEVAHLIPGKWGSEDTIPEERVKNLDLDPEQIKKLAEKGVEEDG